MKSITWCYGDGLMGRVFWIRIFGYGFKVKKASSPMLFSERNGYRKTHVILGLRFTFLVPDHI